jgi:hypothetical protein
MSTNAERKAAGQTLHKFWHSTGGYWPGPLEAVARAFRLLVTGPSATCQLRDDDRVSEPYRHTVWLIDPDGVIVEVSQGYRDGECASYLLTKELPRSSTATQYDAEVHDTESRTPAPLMAPGDDQDPFV